MCRRRTDFTILPRWAPAGAVEQLAGPSVQVLPAPGRFDRWCVVVFRRNDLVNPSFPVISFPFPPFADQAARVRAQQVRPGGVLAYHPIGGWQIEGVMVRFAKVQDIHDFSR